MKQEPEPQSDGLAEAIETMASNWSTIMAEYERQAAAFSNLMSRGHDEIGRVLKCHLVLEHYMDSFLSDHYSLSAEEIEAANLRFVQKAALLPPRAAAGFVRSGVFEVNKIRNRLAHRLGTDLDGIGCPEIDKILKVARPGSSFPGPVEKVEAFTNVACTFLLVSPSEIRDLFARAFARFGPGTDASV